MPIGEHSVINSVHTGINYSASFEQWEACVAAGLDLERWERADYAPRFMARVVAWYRGHMAVEQHIQDAVARKMKADAKRKS